MTLSRRQLFASAVAAQFGPARPGVVRYIRYSLDGVNSYGRLEGDKVQPLSGDLFSGPVAAGKAVDLKRVKLLYPCVPPKVLAVGRNYKSHLGDVAPPPRPEFFYKPVTSLLNPGDAIVIPADSKNTHYEGEIVAVIGKTCRMASVAEAAAAIFGYTCGNDVSERDWQGGADKDMQWWRAKGSDTFGPLGPAIAVGLDPKAGLMLTTRLNGEVVQKQSTADLIYDCAAVVAFASRYVTLTPGDVIYTGTPGSTKAMKPGDVVEIEIEGIGTLRNAVRGA